MTVTYSVTVLGTATGDNVMENNVVSSTAGTNCPSTGGDARCASRILVSELTIAFAATPATVTPGQVVTFQATITNSGNSAYYGLTVDFSATDVRDDADFTGTANATSGTLTATTEALRWNGDLPVGATVTVSVEVRVRSPGSGNGVLSSRATVGVPSANCRADSVDPSCVATSTVLVPRLTIVKSSPALIAVPGERVTFTLTITNSGDTAYTGIEVRDSLAGGLDDAAYESSAIVSGGGTLTYTAPNLIWSGDLAVDGVVTITYAVVVNSPAIGDKNIVDVVTSTAPGSNCVAGAPAPGCRLGIVVLTPGLTITTVADSYRDDHGRHGHVHDDDPEHGPDAVHRRPWSTTRWRRCSTTPPTPTPPPTAARSPWSAGTRCAGPAISPPGRRPS